LEKLHQDLGLAERLQKSKLPLRFPEMKGMRVSSRYMAGMRSGGDYFDLAESQDKGQVSWVLTDSSSYGLSSAVLSVLMRVMMKLSAQEVRSSSEVLRKIRDELLLPLSEKDRLSIFYGTLSRKDYKLRFSNLGQISVFYAPPGKSFQHFPSQGAPLSKNEHEIPAQEMEIALEPGGRLALISDGFPEILGSAENVQRILNQFREKEPKDCLNELVYGIKAGFAEPDDLPAQDCTAVIVDIDARVLRLS
jgi:serine phosphatase RsbU (regulator of sigma subunit)